MTDKIKKNIVNKRNLKIAGRRADDRHQCAIHDFVMGKNEDWFEWIRKTVELNDTKISRRFEVMEQSLSKYITKWAVGTILTVFTCLFGAILILSRWQVQSVHEDVLRVVQSVELIRGGQQDIQIDQAKFNLIQQDVLVEIENLKQDQGEIANDVFNIKNDLNYDRTKLGGDTGEKQP